MFYHSKNHKYFWEEAKYYWWYFWMKKMSLMNIDVSWCLKIQISSEKWIPNLVCVKKTKFRIFKEIFSKMINLTITYQSKSFIQFDLPMIFRVYDLWLDPLKNFKPIPPHPPFFFFPSPSPPPVLPLVGSGCCQGHYRETQKWRGGRDWGGGANIEKNIIFFLKS